jgi:hypothetical protein
MRFGGWLLLAAAVSCGGRKPLLRADGAADAVADGATIEAPADVADVAPDVTIADGDASNGDSSDGDATDDDASDASTSSPIARAAIALETAKVAYANRCAPYPTADLAAVLARARPELQVRAVAEGRAAFDAQKAAACQAAWAAADCLAPPPECTLLEPLVPEGGRCVVPNDDEESGCVRGTKCRYESTCTGVCEPRLGMGAPCGPTSINRGDCLEGMHCVLIAITAQCRPIGREGDPCSGTSNSGCDLRNGFECTFDPANYVCQRLPATGPCAANTVSYRCDPRVAYCSPQGQCVPLGELGDPCVSDDYCLPAFVCSDGVCTRRLRAVGEACRASELCVRGAHCDEGTKTCQRPKAAGLPCSYDAECAGNCSRDTHRCEAWRPSCER